MNAVTDKFAGLNKTSTLLAAAVPDFDGKSFKDHWNDKFAPLLTLTDHDPYKTLNIAKARHAQRFEDLPKEQQAVIAPNVIAVVSRIETPTATCECTKRQQTCPKCISDGLIQDPSHVGHFVESNSNVVIHFFTLGSENDVNAFFQALEDKIKKQELFETLNHVNNGLMTPWGMFFGNSYMADRDIAGEIRHIMRAQRNRERRNDTVAGGRKELEECQTLFANGDFSQPEKWETLSPGSFSYIISSIADYEKEVTRGRIMKLEFEEVKSTLGANSELVHYLKNDLKSKNLTIEDFLANANANLSQLMRNIKEKLKDAEEIIAAREIDTNTFPVLTKDSHIDHVKKLYEIEWKENWGPLPAYVHYYI